MKPLSILLLASAASLVGGGLAAVLHADARSGNGDDATAALVRLEQRLDALSTEQLALRESVERLRISESAGRAAQPLGLHEIDAAIDRALAVRSEAAALSPGGSAPAAAGAPAQEPEGGDLDELLARLTAPDIDEEGWQAVWGEIRKAGLMAEALAWFEHRAKLTPSDPDVHVALGGAYIQKIFEVGNGPDAGIWATKADRAFDAALALEPGNWDARFSKAVSLSFWPALFGKQPEAIAHFETLVQAQEGRAPEPRFAQTYLLLGNLYAQTGKADRAREVWERGLRYFPTDSELMAKSKP